MKAARLSWLGHHAKMFFWKLHPLGEKQSLFTKGVVISWVQLCLKQVSLDLQLCELTLGFFLLKSV